MMIDSVSHIHMVKFIALKRVINDRGQLTEVQRCDDESYLGFGQAYLTLTKPGVVKAWYCHVTQIDQIMLIKGALLLVLYDGRENSPTFQCLQEIKLNEASPLLVQIPSGVWHGFMAYSEVETLLLHLNTIPWDSLSPDEQRLPHNYFSIPYQWPCLNFDGTISDNQ